MVEQSRCWGRSVGSSVGWVVRTGGGTAPRRGLASTCSAGAHNKGCRCRFRGGVGAPGGARPPPAPSAGGWGAAGGSTGGWGAPSTAAAPSTGRCSASAPRTAAGRW